eukprot:5164588-Prymnesium_polylepis.3
MLCNSCTWRGGVRARSESCEQLLHRYERYGTPHVAAGSPPAPRHHLRRPAAPLGRPRAC